MENNEFRFKSYCWSIGTTSYRTVNFNKSIELQLSLLSNFRDLPDYKDKTWREIQSDYYYYLKDNNFVSGDAARPDKDAREKTSGLVDIGLLNDERYLSNVGKELLNISRTKDFRANNDFDIPKDSFLFLKQMLKTYNLVNDSIVRPFIVFLYLVLKLDHLSNDEFAYLLPLCINSESTNDMIMQVKKIRQNEITIDDAIIRMIMNMDNYVNANKYLFENEVNEDVICTIGMNRKSKTYDKPYFALFQALLDIANDRNVSAENLYNIVRNLSGNPANHWIKYLFNTTNLRKIKGLNHAALNEVSLLRQKDIKEFKNEFFWKMHLFKVKSTLSDYFDLNRRYFRTTDIVLFNESKVELDIIPKSVFYPIKDKLIEIAFDKSDKLFNNVELSEISELFRFEASKTLEQLSSTLGITVKTTEEAKIINKKLKYERFHNLIDERFGKDQLIEILSWFENREDIKLNEYITDNADIPTLFEYILGIAWYEISERHGEILDYMKLSLDANLLPKSHAVGGDADIVFEYNNYQDIPNHVLLIEATLSEKSNQRRMEMEPVSRHLGDYVLKNRDKHAYSLFISTYLNINVISDFRNRKNYEYFSSDSSSSVKGLMIIPLQTSELKKALVKDIRYSSLFETFNLSYKSDIDTKDWYLETIENVLN